MIKTPFLSGKRVFVMGLGKSGTAAIAALRASGSQVLAWDDGEKTRATADMDLFDPADLDFKTIDLAVWSPGIAHTFPQPHPAAQAARAAKVPVVCDVELLALAKPQCRFVGITGTNGKSTATTLTAHILTQAGIANAAGGNLGTAALSLPDLGEDGVYVLELSSYQLELIESLRLNAAALLNISPDHLGRHGGMDGYIAAKRRLFDFVAADGCAVIGIDDQPCADMARTVNRALPVSVKQDLQRGISAASGVLRADGEDVMDLTDIAALPGRHNHQNACIAFALTRALGIGKDAIIAGIRSYPGLAHRQQLIAEKNGVRWINDSKATNAEAAETALVCYENIHWIIGGQAKEGGIAALAPHFHRIKHAYLIGEAAEDFAATLSGKVAFSRCGTLDQAVAAAASAARSGDVVLLSPACASWDQFTSFEHRGDVFRQLTEALS